MREHELGLEMAYAGSASGLNVLLYAMALSLVIEWGCCMCRLVVQRTASRPGFQDIGGTGDIYVHSQAKGGWELA